MILKLLYLSSSELVKMKVYFIYILFSLILIENTRCQNFGIVRKNFISYNFDPASNTTVEVLDSSTIRLGSIDPYTGIVTNLGIKAYSIGINLNSATINPYLNHYYIGSGPNLLTFDTNTGNIINNVPVTGAFTNANFQNYRFNPSDSTIYGMVPQNFYSTYFDSLSLTTFEVLDSSKIRFGSLNPVDGTYSIIGNASFDNLYTLAGNSIDPYQMIYYYSAVNKLVGIDLYTGAKFKTIPIKLPRGGIFENIAYSCADTSIYGLTRQNYISTVFDSLFMGYVDVIDSTTFKLTRINPKTGEIRLISPYNIKVGGNLTGGAYVDPNSMTYFFNFADKIVGVSMFTGLITSSVRKQYESGEIAIDMMRSAQNCLGAPKLRFNPILKTNNSSSPNWLKLHPNPVNNELYITCAEVITDFELMDSFGRIVFAGDQKQIDMSPFSSGIYYLRVKTSTGSSVVEKIIKY